MHICIKVDQACRLNIDSCGTCLIYRINESLCITLGELSNHFSLIVVQEDRRDQRDALVHGEGMTNQPFPGFTAREEAVKLMDVRSSG